MNHQHLAITPLGIVSLLIMLIMTARSNGGLFYLCLLALGLFDDSEVQINDVLGEGDNITFIVRI